MNHELSDKNGLKLNDSSALSKSYQLIIFDWEGTLGDTVGQSLCRIALEASRHSFTSEGANEELFRGNLLQAAKGFFHDWSDAQLERYCLTKSIVACSDSAAQCLFPFAKDFIVRLNRVGMKLAIASNKAPSALQSALQRSSLEAFFTVTRAAGQTPPKPCPQMLEEILLEFSLGVEVALMIGDSVSDIEMACQLGMDAVGFDFYHQNSDLLFEAGAKAVFDNYQDIAHFLGLSKEG